MNFDLPIMSGDAKPEFADAESCSEWLQSLPLVNVAPSHGRLLGQLEELNCFELAAAERMKILELLREPVIFVQTEHARKFCAKAVPLSNPEREIFDNVLALWDALAYGWEHCLHGLATDAEGLEGSAALICQRALWSVAQKIAERFKAYQVGAEQEWRRLHRIYAFAESRSVERDAVPHPASTQEGTTNCAETYAHALLTALANPNQHTAREQLLISRWTARWARKVAISREPPAGAGIAPLTVQLESGAGASRSTQEGADVRFLHVDELEKSIRKRLAMLRNGEPPEALGLGSDVASSVAASILLVLHQQWCEDKAARQGARRLTGRNAVLCTGIAAPHYYLTGQAFRQPGEPRELSQRQRNEIATFGQVSTRDDTNYIAAQVSGLEHWKVCDESIAGFCLERPEDGGNSRFTHGQLVAVRPSDATTFIVCTLRWLSVSTNGVLRMGTRAIPGVPRGVAVRPTGLNVLSEKYVPALLLPAIPALHSPETLVLPSGWYRPKRVIELYTDKVQQVMLASVVDHGGNFDRCTFEPAYG